MKTYIEMFEAKLSEASVLKRIIDAIKDLVTDVNIESVQTVWSNKSEDLWRVLQVHLPAPQTNISIKPLVPFFLECLIACV